MALPEYDRNIVLGILLLVVIISIVFVVEGIRNEFSSGNFYTPTPVKITEIDQDPGLSEPYPLYPSCSSSSVTCTDGLVCEKGGKGSMPVCIQLSDGRWACSSTPCTE